MLWYSSYIHVAEYCLILSFSHTQIVCHNTHVYRFFFFLSNCLFLETLVVSIFFSCCQYCNECRADVLSEYNVLLLRVSASKQFLVTWKFRKHSQQWWLRVPFSCYLSNTDCLIFRLLKSTLRTYVYICQFTLICLW